MPVIAPSLTLPGAADMTGPRASGEAARAAGPEDTVMLISADLRPLFHLFPPVPGAEGGQARSWRDSFGLGLRHYRRGPGFVVVYDNRPGSGPGQFLLTSADEIAWFDRLHDPGTPPLGDPAVTRLRDAGLLFGLGGKYVMPICRLRRLPLPTHLI